MAKKGLGKGLDALFASDLNSPSSEVSSSVETEVKIADIDPNKAQPRKLFFDDSLEELAESIRIHGILQPLALRRRENGRYQIIAGERRFRAAKLAALTEIPALVMETDDQTASQLVGSTAGSCTVPSTMQRYTSPSYTIVKRKQESLIFKSSNTSSLTYCIGTDLLP